MSRRALAPALALALALALATAGCALPERGEGEESLVVKNSAGEDVGVILRILQEGGIEVYAEELFLPSGASTDRPVTMAPARHAVYLTTTNHLSEVFPLEIPAEGDTHIEIEISRGRASITLT